MDSRKVYRWCLIAGAAVGIQGLPMCSSPSAWSEDEAWQYQKGYVNQILASDSGNTDVERSDGKENGRVTVVPSVDHTVSGSMNDGPRKLSAVVYVNSQDKDHCDSVLKRVLRLHTARRLSAITVLFMGTYKNISHGYSEMLERAGISLDPIFSMPKELPIERSPAWIISDAKKYYLLDGVFEPERFFTPNGIFIPPMGMEVEDGAGNRNEGELKSF